MTICSMGILFIEISLFHMDTIVHWNNTISKLYFRYDLPGIDGINFVLRNSLGGGGIASLRSDPQVNKHY